MRTPHYIRMSEPIFEDGRLTVDVEVAGWWIRWMRFKAGLRVIWIGIKFIFKKYD
jgi:hypothetical protein